MTSSDSPTEGSRDVSASADSNEAPFDDVTASSEDPTGGEGPEERAMHVTDG